MGRFLDRVRKSRDGAREFWKTLSSEDVKEPQECKFEGELAAAIEKQKIQEKSYKSLIFKLNHQNNDNKEQFKVNKADNARVETSKNNIQKIEQQIESSKNQEFRDRI